MTEYVGVGPRSSISDVSSSRCSSLATHSGVIGHHVASEGGPAVVSTKRGVHVSRSPAILNVTFLKKGDHKTFCLASALLLD